MEKLTVVNNFTKSIDFLRNTESSQKEKLNHFHQISECLLSPSMISNVNFNKFLSSAINVLLLFCEDLDSVVRMNSEENLYKIIRGLENGRISRILLDLFNEIKKNGNQKSLRICLNVFSYYCPRIKEKYVKSYALKLIPCLQAIAQRKETLLIESLAEFMKTFSKNLQICLNDNETFKLLEVFLNDIKSDCAVKRRCSSQNCLNLIENSRNSNFMIKCSLEKTIEFLINDHQLNTTLGVLGFFRLILPVQIAQNICDHKQIIEIYDYCLFLLNDTNHSIINASLEVINSILVRYHKNHDLRKYLISNQLLHNEILKKRKSLKNQIFQLKNHSITCPEYNVLNESLSKYQQQKSSRKSTTETIKDAFKSSEYNNKINQNQDIVSGMKSIELEDSFNKFTIDDSSSTSNICNNKIGKKIGKNQFETNDIQNDNNIIDEIDNNDDDDDDVHLSIEQIEDKSQILSDMDNESINSIDFESEIAIGERVRRDSIKPNTTVLTTSNETQSFDTVKSQKSTDSIGSFFNNLLSHPNTETMTKLFRPSTKLSVTTTDTVTTITSPPPVKIKDFQKDEKPISKTPTKIQHHTYPSTIPASILTFEDDTISLESINSHMSLGSHVSLQSGSTIQDLPRSEQDLVLIQKNDYENDEFIASTADNMKNLCGLENEKMNTNIGNAKELSYNDKIDNNIENNDNKDNDNIKLDIGTIYEQNIIHYTARFISSKFLLNGTNGLISDTIVRVSIKNLSLNVLGNCVKLLPDILQLSLEIDKSKLCHIKDIDLLSTSSSSVNEIDDNSSGNEIGNDFDMGDHSDDCNPMKISKFITQTKLEDNLLEIKDDHFGESTTKFLFDTPLSKSVDQILITDLNKTNLFENKILESNEKQNQPKLNQQFEKILSKSEIIESKSYLKKSKSNQKTKSKRPSREYITGMDSSIPSSPVLKSLNTFISEKSKSHEKETIEIGYQQIERNIEQQQREQMFVEEIHQINRNEKNNTKQQKQQFIFDILLFWNHSDPILRGDVQIIIGNFINETFLMGNYQQKLLVPLDFDKLLGILIKGFRDEIHTVVIQALTSFDKIFTHLMLNYFNQVSPDDDDDDNNEMENDDDDTNEKFMNTPENFIDNENFILDLKKPTKFRISPKLLLNELRLCYDNKYWLVQNKYSDVISNLDYDVICEYYDDDTAVTYEKMFLRQLFEQLGDEDFRVREHIAECLCNYIKKRSFNNDIKNYYQINLNIIQEFQYNRLFRSTSLPLCNLLNNQKYPLLKTEIFLSRILYYITNKLMNLNDKNLQFGLINCIKILKNEFNPIDYNAAWNEFNINEICLRFSYENYSTAIDINGQSEIIEISSELLAANILCGSDHSNFVDILFEHILKILNIYNHLFTNERVTIHSKAQKTDLLFTNSKEQALVNNLGYFGNDYLYIKLYEVLKNAYNSYKITINHDSGIKLKLLLQTCLNSLALLLEFKQTPKLVNTIKLIEEILLYLNVLVNYAPVESIASLRQLLKFLFGRNYANRKKEYENFMKLYFSARNHCKNQQQKMNKIRMENSEYLDENQKQGVYNFTFKNGNDNHSLAELFVRAMNFPLGKSKSEEECAKHIKLFEPLVVYCLGLFMKSNAIIQAPILDLLSQLFEFNVTYSILDSKSVIFEQVLKHLELIENGIRRNSNIIIPSIIKFLSNITKQSDKKLITYPKIISITNNLLANSNVRECSVIALRELTFEIFFNTMNTNSGFTSTPTSANDLSTQKEVVIGMLEKFIDSIECQKMLAILLLWNRTNCILETELETIIHEGAILSIVTKSLEENGKIEVKCRDSFFTLDSLFRNSDKNVLLESKSFESVLSVFIKKNVNDFNNLSIVTIILDNVILKTEEIYLVTQIKLFLKNNEEILNINEINYFAKVLYEKLETCFSTLITYPHDKDYHFLVEKFITALVSVSSMDTLNSALRLTMTENGFYKNYLKIILSIENFQLNIFQLLLALNLDKSLMLNHVQDIHNKNIQKIIIEEICFKNNNINEWTNEEIDLLLCRKFLPLLVDLRTSLFIDMCSYFQYANIILKNILNNIKDLSKENIINIFGLFKILHKKCLSLKLEFLLKVYTQENSNHSIQKLIESNIDEEFMIIRDLQQSQLIALYTKDDFNNIKGIFMKMPFSVRSTTSIEAFDEFSRVFEKDESNADIKSLKNEQKDKVDEKSIINEVWLNEQIINMSTNLNHNEFVKILSEFKLESKLKTIFNSPGFDSVAFLDKCIEISFETMFVQFQNNCVQFNPHIDYMKMNPLLIVSIDILMKNIKLILNKEEFDDIKFIKIVKALIVLLDNIKKWEDISLIYVQAKCIDKFIQENLQKLGFSYELLISFAVYCSNRIMKRLNSNRIYDISLEINTYLKCIDEIFKLKLIWYEINQPDKYETHLNAILDMLYDSMIKSIHNTIFLKKYQIQTDRYDLHKNAEGDNVQHLKNVQKVMFIGKLIETKISIDPSWKFIYGTSSMKILKSIAISLLRTNYFYAYAVTPMEIFQSYGHDRQPHSSCKLPSIPVDHLSDVEILQKFVRRLSIFGFSTRQQFEEYFMTFLLLINKVYDEHMVDSQEQFQIKSTCLTAILELLMTCKTFPSVGNKLSRFHHSIRWPKVKCDNVSLKKLHKVQLIVPGSNVFYHPNLERITLPHFDDNIIGTNNFLLNQYELNHIWQQMEEPTPENDYKEDTYMKNFRYFQELSGIDLKSSCQLIFDVLTQLIEQNHILVLPNLAKFCEICDNREQIKWIKDTMLKLQENIPIDDTISHQYIIYLLCKTQSILVPSYSELSHLCSIISTYLKSMHVFIRIATLHGLLCLLECCLKTKMTIGKMSEELSLIRELIVGYITRHGIIEESTAIYSDVHTKLVWVLNFSLIEMTTKFVPECHLLSNTIISANNLLKRTSNEAIYLCVLHGLERIVIMNCTPKPICDKIEKLALELVKFENERFSLPALKLLLSCIYMGSSKQLENTEQSNGIVQDDPEIIVQQTEKVDVLLHRIKSSTSSAAKIYGEVLCQIIRDLVPPNEILTKVIKEFLAINQPHCEVIAQIVYQIFHLIDSAFLQMLQDWLICSLPNFVTLPIDKGVWSLTVIFLSASKNLHLIEIFPFVLNEFKKLGDPEIALFVTSAQDFYMKLNAEQKERFREIFSTNEILVYKKMLETL